MDADGSRPARSVTQLVAAVNPFAVPRRRKDWVYDWILFVLAVIEIIFTALGYREAYRQLPDWWLPIDVAAGIVAAVLLWWRRRFPVQIGVGLALLGGLFLSAGMPAVVSVYTVATVRRIGVALVIIVLHMSIAVPYYFFVPLTPGFGWWVAMMTLIYGTALSIGIAVRARREVIMSLITSAERDRSDYETRLGEVRRAEREQIAREMHDVLAHRISLLSVHAGALEYRTKASADGGAPLSEAEIGDAATVIRDASHRALEELRQVLAVLTVDEAGSGVLGTDPPPVGLAELPHLINEASLANQVVRFRQRLDHDQLAGLTRSAQRTVFRTVQEGLTNARKHTPGAEVEVQLDGSPGRELTVTISNQLPIGATRAEIPGAGRGLTGLTERVRLDGGALTHDVVDGRFVLMVRLPWRS